MFQLVIEIEFESDVLQWRYNLDVTSPFSQILRKSGSLDEAERICDNGSLPHCYSSFQDLLISANYRLIPPTDGIHGVWLKPGAYGVRTRGNHDRVGFFLFEDIVDYVGFRSDLKTILDFDGSFLFR